MNRKTIFISVAGILLLAFVMATVIYKNHQAANGGAAGGRNQGVVERQGAPIKGPVDATRPAVPVRTFIRWLNS